MSSKTTWIMLRGLGRESAHWGPFFDQFVKAFPEDRVVAIDLPGAGEYYEQTAPRSVEALFNFVRAQSLARSEVHTRFKLFAVSLGAMVAMEWIRQKEDELDEVVLVNPSSRLSPFYDRLRWQIWRRFLKLLTVQSAREREKGILEILVNREEAREAALPVWTKVAIERPVSYINFFNQLYAASRFNGLTRTPKVPVLLLNSLGDKLVDPSCSTRLQSYYHWETVRHPWAGHDLPWDDPEWLIAKVLAWKPEVQTQS